MVNVNPYGSVTPFSHINSTVMAIIDSGVCRHWRKDLTHHTWSLYDINMNHTMDVTRKCIESPSEIRDTDEAQLKILVNYVGESMSYIYMLGENRKVIDIKYRLKATLGVSENQMTLIQKGKALEDVVQLKKLHSEANTKEEVVIKLLLAVNNVVTFTWDPSNKVRTINTRL